MLVIYVISIVLVAMLMKIFRRDALEKKLDPTTKAIDKKKSPNKK